jgi:hypothetical protein
MATPVVQRCELLPWLLIPAFLVPLLASTHRAVFYRLVNPAPAPFKGVAGH